ncbi:TetR/AcrR family transcriptional regulator [Leucobacter insecticola]|uniref:TetR/AcrR family transcriptional regulator n=1 Tax=Leucobacter insecticola TaxID=2714934 RepID=A0A6G8FHT9_9MICO|nr:ScbR family autoregulator-binding transcription factor [Leucobacter insecticola]QIM16020.1 TetR/AcrR family transcriptional regulator [Leucobacter insecticola]
MTLNKREAQRGATKAAILQAASEEFDARGYAGTAISDIANRLDLTKGSVYFHFPSKALLAIEIVDRYFSAWVPMLEEVESRGLSGLTAIRWVSEQAAASYRDNATIRASVRLMREASLIDAEMPTPFVDWMENTHRWLIQARDAGELRDGLDLEDAAWHIVAVFHGIQEVASRLGECAQLASKNATIWSLLLKGIESGNETKA